METIVVESEEKTTVILDAEKPAETVKSQPTPETKTTVEKPQVVQPEPIGLKRAITKDGSWELINGERIYQKEVEIDPSIPGHTILKVRTFEPGTNIIKQANNSMDTIHLFDNAQAYVQYYEPLWKQGHNGDKIAQVKAQYDETIKDFIPIIVDKDNNTYIGEEIIQFWLK